jgi:hypothetical protein
MTTQNCNFVVFFNPRGAWNFTLREEARLAVFQNKFRIIFRYQKDQVKEREKKITDETS